MGVCYRNSGTLDRPRRSQYTAGAGLMGSNDVKLFIVKMHQSWLQYPPHRPATHCGWTNFRHPLQSALPSDLSSIVKDLNSSLVKTSLYFALIDFTSNLIRSSRLSPLNSDHGLPTSSRRPPRGQVRPVQARLTRYAVDNLRV